MSKFNDIDRLCISTVRLLAVDAVQKANSGHPGAPLGLAPAMHVLCRDFMNVNHENVDWPNRDRFVLSNGHACALLYSTLHLLGYDYTIDDLKRFRSVGSKTPGHPEYELPGVELTTGPLGQGISNAVGFAIAQAHIAARYNKKDCEISTNYTYVFAGDGCMQEGVSSEACSLAGHLQLGNLIVIYDDNSITIDGKTNLSFTEEVAVRYRGYGWEVIEVKDGNDNLDAISQAIKLAKSNKKQPTLIKLTTTIGFGSLNEGTYNVHGSPLKPDDVKQLKKRFGFNSEESFVVPQEVYDFYKEHMIERGKKANEEWNSTLEEYMRKYPELGAELKRRIAGILPPDWESALPTFKPEDGDLATRKLSASVINSLAKTLPELIGGSADLTPSNLTRWDDAIDFQPDDTKIGSYMGRYIRYGVREHGMSAILNGISAYGYNLKPFGGTFLNFVSYASGAVRLAALSGYPVIWVATHDSIGLGEDGPTHQPIETVTHFRALPNMQVWRPADGNEVSAAYKVSIESKATPSIICLTRQNVPQLEGSSIEKAAKGGYAISEYHGNTTPKLDLILVSSGSEVSLCCKSAEKYSKDHKVNIRVVSLPDFYTFGKQPFEYRISVLPDEVPILSVEVYATLSMCKYSHEQFGLDRFGMSGKSKEVYEYFEFTPDGVASRIAKVLSFYSDKTIRSPVRKALA
ncbi:hypothetical protein TPHA_0M01660 [Tetrapisispora phaffii CBS 4417]|uniref:Transketolase n=1 Tax=Tetrapisispora phaffii (strain ATCC 24235 / CBS 4417 / NBRC 1672 / NRRL Y-8282 / UCD 70-5) TaxID=1071381 RepID=G8C0M6_TETPH|nr:hypothetical protein TPHA_0M01660 [Tetrapisispora phaffii CBS 4417]CCE65741.1 hypothetical protein TPHA_0M01660 [Tetrapisispora phaffii CBS 4417]